MWRKRSIFQFIGFFFVTYILWSTIYPLLTFVSRIIIINSHCPTLLQRVELGVSVENCELLPYPIGRLTTKFLVDRPPQAIILSVLWQLNCHGRICQEAHKECQTPGSGPALWKAPTYCRKRNQPKGCKRKRAGRIIRMMMNSSEKRQKLN